MRIEACVGSVESAIEAEIGGAARVELCDNLHDGGTTPSLGAIEAARRELEIDLNVIIRPRGGDFLYSDLELDIMKTDVQATRTAGADGVVFGILEAKGAVNLEQSRQLVDLAGPMSTTFHRAFDMCADPFAALEDGRIIVMPGVGIDASNIAHLMRLTGAGEYHVLAQRPVDSDMVFRNPDVFMGADPALPEFERPVCDREAIREIVDAVAMDNVRGRDRVDSS
jgi:copper homeostasis protein